jgi:hypothetical protein
VILRSIFTDLFGNIRSVKSFVCSVSKSIMILIMKSHLSHFEQFYVAGLPSLLGSFAIIAATVFALSFYASRSDRSAKTSHQLPLPPGPKPWPIVGNLLDVPRAREWETLTKWRGIYGMSEHQWQL